MSDTDGIRTDGLRTDGIRTDGGDGADDANRILADRGHAQPQLAIGGRSRRSQLGVGAVIVLLLAGLAISVVVSLLSGRGSTDEIPVESPSTGAAGVDSSAGAGDSLMVHVSGAVATPGVYTLTASDRVIDVIAAAGGFSATADQRAVNLARFVVDGEQIIVPDVGAAPPPGGGAPENGASGGTVNLNQATAEQLEALPRVGPALAERIVQWRTENGPFQSVDDLLNVAGIGDKTLDGFRSLVTV